MNIRQTLEELADGEHLEDTELKKLAHVIERFIQTLPEQEQKALSDPDTTQTAKLQILTRLGMQIPFDYTFNSVKTAKN